MNLGRRIRNRRQALGLSVDDVAKKLNKNRATVYRYENNEIEKMPLTILEPLAKVLETTPAELMGWGEDGKAIKHQVPDELSKEDTKWVWFVNKCKDLGFSPEEMEEFIELVKKMK